MKDVFICADNIVSPLGMSSAENFAGVSALRSGVKKHGAGSISGVPFVASLFDKEFPLANGQAYTKFEQLLILSVEGALAANKIDPADKKTLLVISTTKGNISLLEQGNTDAGLPGKISLNGSAKKIAAHFGFINFPVVVSNACISGLVAMITGMRLIRAGIYDHVVVAGADVISKFVLSGFQSFQAVSDEPCRPFDAERKGINLGEGAATVILTADKNLSGGIKISGGAVSNDANHISGPSRTGEELCEAINRALADAGVTAQEIDMVSAHGTATLFNDEMESKAFTLARVNKAPVNSLKGYYGHTLGAAGIIESVISMHSLKNDLLIPTLGFNKPGIPEPLNIYSTLKKATLHHCLKTASGFGGCNAAVILTKHLN